MQYYLFFVFINNTHTNTNQSVILYFKRSLLVICDLHRYLYLSIPMKKGAITIKDIARELNISVSTVSRALADNPLVRPATREAVQELAQKYHYIPHFTALSLRSNKTQTLGIIIPELVHEFFALVIRGVEDVAYAEGYNVIISSSHESYEREVSETRALVNGRIDGLIACVSRETGDFDHFREITDRNLPLVFFDCICEEIAAPKVVIDDYDAGYQAVSHLIQQGRRHIAYVGGPINLLINQARLAGYRQALQDACLTTRDEWVLHCSSGDYEDGRKKTESLIENQEIDGLFAATDLMAIGAMKNMKARGIRIPEDISVVGFSNWSISSLYEPALSTMSQPGYEMGRKAAELIIRQINAPEETCNETVILKSELIVRESSVVIS